MNVANVSVFVLGLQRLLIETIIDLQTRKGINITILTSNQWFVGAAGKLEWQPCILARIGRYGVRRIPCRQQPANEFMQRKADPGKFNQADPAHSSCQDRQFLGIVESLPRKALSFHHQAWRA